MPWYKLRRKYYDGRGTIYRPGQEIELPKELAPSTAIEISKPSAKAAPVASPDEPELELEPAVLDAKPGDTLKTLSNGKAKK